VQTSYKGPCGEQSRVSCGYDTGHNRSAGKTGQTNLPGVDAIESTNRIDEPSDELFVVGTSQCPTVRLSFEYRTPHASSAFFVWAFRIKLLCKKGIFMIDRKRPKAPGNHPARSISGAGGQTRTKAEGSSQHP
jgi:hypothetical protein